MRTVVYENPSSIIYLIRKCSGFLPGLPEGTVLLHGATVKTADQITEVFCELPNDF